MFVDFRMLKEWPNTYTFTKAIAEDAVREYGKGLPVAVVRPAIGEYKKLPLELTSLRSVSL